MNSKRIIINIILFLCSYIFMGCLEPVVKSKQEIAANKSKENVCAKVYPDIQKKGNVVILELKDGRYTNNSEFKYSKDEKESLFIQPYNKIKDSQKEIVEKRSAQREVIINNADTRSRVENTDKWPYNLHAHLELWPCDSNNNKDNKKKIYRGSGVLVGPRHILTAAHNIYDYNEEEKKREWVEKIDVYIGLNGQCQDPQVKTTSVSRAYMFVHWHENLDKEYDMALLVLDKPIGEEIGWYGLLSASGKEALQDLQNETFEITGYPKDRGEGEEAKKQMWTARQQDGKPIKLIRPEQEKTNGHDIIHYIDTEGGQSGSGIWFKKQDDPYLIGVHTTGSQNDKKNYGAWLSPSKFKQVVQWISETH